MRPPQVYWKHPPTTPNKDLVGWKFTCYYCDSRVVLNHHNGIKTTVPIRCELCSKRRYTWQTRKDLQKALPRLAKGYRPSLHTYTLGEVRYLPWEVVHTNPEITRPLSPEQFTHQLRQELKLAFRTFIRSKWWRNRVDGCFYTVEVKVTDTPEGTTYHPHVHAIVLHKNKEDFKSAATERGLGSYVYVRRITGSPDNYLAAPINYVLKYALKDYGDPSLKGRYYERTGAFRKSPGSSK